MKTIEEKAKRYDEAKINGSRLWECGEITRENYEYMFPEIKESEDEMIRKELLNAFQESEDSLYMVLSPQRRKSFIAWLEKQGKNNMSISEATKQVLEDNLNKALEKETPESCNEFLEKQGEQKTADKVEPKFKVGDTIRYNGTEYKITEITPNGYKVYALTYDEDAASLISFSAPAILVEQKPEWNEEDLKTIRQIIRIVKDSGCSNRCYDRIAKFLHNITPNPSRSVFQPQSQWKPSDEQINALEYYIYSTSPTATITKGTIYGNLMVELLEQLKKLKGE